MLRYNIDNSRREKHTALLDCDLLLKVYINLLEQREPTFELNVDKEINPEDQSGTVIKYSKKVIKPTDEEIKLHKDYLKKQIKKNYFN